MTRDEALLMAIEAIENADYHNDLQAIAVIKDIMSNVATNDTSQERVDKTSESVHKPVAWVSSEELLVMRGNALGGAKDWRINVGLVKQDGDVGLYTTPPQRTWVGLTNDELTDLFYNENLGQESAVSQAIALLKERNT